MKKVFALVGIGSLLFLAGCTNVNAAATLDGKTISVQQVQGAVNQILDERKGFDTTQMNLPTGEALNRNELTFFVVGALMDDIAKKLGITVTEREVKSAVDGVIASVGGKANLPMSLVQANIPSSSLNDYFRMYLISKKVQDALTASGVAQSDINAAFGKLVGESATRVHLVVNPRYGKWDSTSGNIVAADFAAGAVIKK